MTWSLSLTRCSISAGSDVHVFSLEKRSWALHLVSDELHLVGGGRSSHTAVAHRDKVHTTRCMCTACALRVHCVALYAACTLHIHTLHIHTLHTAHDRGKVLIIGGKLATLKGRKELGTDRPSLLLAFDMGERFWLPPPAVERCTSSYSPLLAAPLTSLRPFTSPRHLISCALAYLAAPALPG